MITVVPHAPGAGPSVTATPHAPTPGTIGPCGDLYSRAGRSEIKIDAAGRNPDLYKRMNAVWTRVAPLINARGDYGSELTIDYSHLCISYINTGGKLTKLGEFDLDPITAKDLVDEMQEVRSVARKLIRFTSAATAGIHANRPTTGVESPFEKTAGKWMQHASHSADDFIKKGKLKKVQEALTARGMHARAAAAEEDIRRTDSFIDALQADLARRKAAKEVEIQNLPENTPIPDRTRATEELKELEKLCTKMERLDRDVIFYNVAVRGVNINPNADTAQRLNQEAAFIKKLIVDDLKENVRDRLFTSPWNKDSALDTMIEVYGQNAGALPFHDRWQYQEYAAAQPRSERVQGTMEECVVHAMTHLRTPGFLPAGSLSSLALRGDPADPTRTAALDALTAAATSARGYTPPPPPVPKPQSPPDLFYPRLP